MHDNKVRLSRDVLEKAEYIASEWGLKNARAAIEAVFRCYCDHYLYGRIPVPNGVGTLTLPLSRDRSSRQSPGLPSPAVSDIMNPVPTANSLQCEALDALDELLAL